MEATLYQLLFIDHHVVTKVVKSKLVVGDIGDITVVCFSTLIVVHAV